MIVKWFINTGFAGAKHHGEWEIDDAEWEEMTEKNRHEMLDEMMQDEMRNHLDCGWEIQETEK